MVERVNPQAVKRPRILYVVNVDWFFLSHRLPIARGALQSGFDVTVAAADTGKGAQIRDEGFDFLPLPFSRKGTNPLAELTTLMHLVHLYLSIKPDLIHHVTIKPVLYGSMAARVAGNPLVVNAVTGLGFSFSNSSTERPILRWVVKSLYRWALHNPSSATILQNPDDRERLIISKLISPEKTVLIRGSGVDCRRFVPAAEAEGHPLVVLPSRMLWDKGIQDFVDAAAIVRRERPNTRFALVGAPDEGNPTAVPVKVLETWVRDGLVEWWGQQSDMPSVLRQAAIVALPTTYPEGVPKALLEAAASARPIVATDAPGCREVVRANVNGLLVPSKAPHELAKAIIYLVDHPEVRERFGQAGREIAQSEFAEEIVVAQTLDLYRRMLGSRWPKLQEDRP